MGEVPYGHCDYCDREGPLQITYFYFPIKCECCSPQHHLRVQHCGRCEAVMPNSVRLTLSTKRLQDPLVTGLFVKL